jgi:ribosome-associated heat shock protein Hsp15
LLELEDVRHASHRLMEKHRIDKWLWAARFFKTRALAVEEIDKGRIQVNGQVAKPSRELREGDLIDWRQAGLTRSFVIQALSRQRGPATTAQALYAETEASIASREAALAARRLSPEPASTIEQGRPTKRDRRQLVDWDRWSASVDGD